MSKVRHAKSLQLYMSHIIKHARSQGAEQMSAALATLAIAAVPAFVASVVEWVEAFTIVLAIGNTRGWRSPVWGVVGGLGTLAVIVGVFGTPLVIYQEEVKQSFHI